MKNDLFSIGPFTVHGYGLMIAIGVLSAYYMVEYRAKKETDGLGKSVPTDGLVGAGRLFGLEDSVSSDKTAGHSCKSGASWQQH